MTRCRILKDFTWPRTGFIGKQGGFVSPPAMLREIWLRHGFVEVFGEEAAERKEVVAAEPERKRRKAKAFA